METYNGATLYKDLNFNLYGDEDMDFKESKESILEAFTREYFQEIKDTLATAGLLLEKLEYYSPKFYNFAGDSIDPTIGIKNPEKLHAYIKQHTKELQQKLDDNHSYDGFISFTPETVADIDNANLIIVIEHIMHSIDFSCFEIHNHMIREEEE